MVTVVQRRTEVPETVVDVETQVQERKDSPKR